MDSNDWEQVLDSKFRQILNSYKTGRMTINKVEEARDLLLRYKHQIFQEGEIQGKQRFLSQCETYLKIFFKFSLKKCLKKQDFLMIRDAFYTLWSVIHHKNLYQHKFLLQKMTLTLDVYLSVDTKLHFSKEFLRLYTGLISASSEEKRNIARSIFKSYKLLGRSLQDSDDLELQLLIAEVLLKLYLKKGFDLLLQDLIPGLPEAVLQTEDLYAQNELYRCIKHILKPIGTTPSATNNTVTLNCQVSIDGCLLIEHELGHENILRFDRKSKIISFFCGAEFLKKICNFNSFCVTTSWEVLSFSGSDAESFAYTIKPISETLQMEIKIPNKSFNLCLGNSNEEKSNISISINRDERAHDILKNIIFKEFFYSFCGTTQEFKLQNLEEYIGSSGSDSSYRARRKMKHSRTEHIYLAKSLSPLSMKAPQEVALKRSALNNLPYNEEKKRKISVAEKFQKNRKISRLKEQNSTFSTLRNIDEIFITNLDTSKEINSSLGIKLYDDTTSNSSLTKVEEWLRINPVEIKPKEISIVEPIELKVPFALPAIPKKEVLSYQATESNMITCSETSSNLPLDWRVNRYLNQEFTTENKTENVCSSQELLHILKDSESIANSTKNNIYVFNDNCLNQNCSENVTNMSHQIIENGFGSSNAIDCISELKDEINVEDTVLNDPSNYDCNIEPINEPNCKEESISIFESNENNSFLSNNFTKKGRSEGLSDISIDLSLNHQSKKNKMSTFAMSPVIEHGKNRRQAIKCKENEVLIDVPLNNYKKSVQSKISTVDLSCITKQNKTVDLSEYNDNLLSEEKLSHDSGSFTKKKMAADLQSPIIKRSKSKDHSLSIAEYRNNNSCLLKSTSILSDDLNNNSLSLDGKLSSPTKSKIAFNLENERKGYEKRVLQQNKFPIVLLERLPLKVYNNNNLIHKTSNPIQNIFLTKFELELTRQDLKLPVTKSNKKNTLNEEDLISRTGFDKRNVLEEDPENDLNTNILFKAVNTIDKPLLQPHLEVEKKLKHNDLLVTTADICKKFFEKNKPKRFSNCQLSSQSTTKNKSSESVSLSIQNFKEHTKTKTDGHKNLKKFSDTKNKNKITKNSSNAKRLKQIFKDEQNGDQRKDSLVTQQGILKKNQNVNTELASSKLTTQITPNREKLNKETVSVAKISSNLIIADVDLNNGKLLSELKHKSVRFDKNLILAAATSEINTNNSTLEHNQHKILKADDFKPTNTTEDKTNDNNLICLDANSEKNTIERDNDFNIITTNKPPNKRLLYEGNDKIESFSKSKNLSKCRKEDAILEPSFGSNICKKKGVESKFEKWSKPFAEETTFFIENVNLLDTLEQIENTTSSNSNKNKNGKKNFLTETKQNKVKPTGFKPISSCMDSQENIVGNDCDFKVVTSTLKTQHLLYKKTDKLSCSTKPKILSKSNTKVLKPKASLALRKSLKNNVSQAKKARTFVKKDEPFCIVSLPSYNKHVRKDREQVDIIEKDNNCSVTSASELPTKRQLYKENDDTFISFPGESLVLNFSDNKSSITSREPTRASNVNSILGKEKIEFGMKTKKTCSAALEKLLKNQKAKSKIESKYKNQFDLSSEESFILLNNLEKSQNDTQSKRNFESVKKLRNGKRQVCDKSSKINIISDIVLQTQDGLLDLVFRAGIKGVKETPPPELYENRNARLLYLNLHNIFG